MITALIWIVVIVLALIVAGYGYWVLLLSRYPEPIVADEVHTFYTRDLWRLTLYRLKARKDPGEPVLLCHGLGANHLCFLAPKGVSLADALADEGYDCWVLDYRGDRSAQAPFVEGMSSGRIEDYVEQDLPAALGYIRHATGYGQVHFVGHSLGGMVLYAYEQLVGPGLIASAATLAAPPGFKGMHYVRSQRLLALTVNARPLASAVMRGLAPFYRSLHLLLNVFPINWGNMRPEVGAAHFFHGLEASPPEVVAEMDFWVTNKVWLMRGDSVDIEAGLATLKTPLLAVFGAADPFIAPERAQEFFEALPGADKHMIMLSTEAGHSADYSHIDILFAPQAREEVFEPIAEWFKAHPIALLAEQTNEEAKPAKRKPAAKKKAVAKAAPKAKAKPAAKRKAAPARKQKEA